MENEKPDEPGKQNRPGILPRAPMEPKPQHEREPREPTGEREPKPDGGPQPREPMPESERGPREQVEPPAPHGHCLGFGQVLGVLAEFIALAFL